MVLKENTRNKVFYLLFFCRKEHFMDRLYSYNGPVLSFDRTITSKWKSDTYAGTEKKAKSNLIFQYKNQHGLLPTASIKLPGKITTMEEKDG